MTKKVDLQQLLNKKYDKPDELTYQTLMEEIDKVLEQSSNTMAWSKIVDPGNIEEYYVNSWTDSSTRNEKTAEPGYKENVKNIPQVVPDKLAEDVPTFSQEPIKTGKTRGATYEYKVVVPDMMELLYKNQQIATGEDKALVDSIINSIPGNNWIERINYANKMLNQQLLESEKNFDFQTMISSLVMINCLKKIAFDVGKLSKGGIFEYFMAKLCGADYEVIDSRNNTVIDIAPKEGGTGLSLKLLGNYSGVSIRGSRRKLGQNLVNYIIAQSLRGTEGKDSVINFYDIKIRGVTDLPQDVSYDFKNEEIHVNLNYIQETQFKISLPEAISNLRGPKNTPDVSINFKDLDSYNRRLNKLVRMYQSTVYTILTNLSYLNGNLTKYLSVKETDPSHKGSPKNSAYNAIGNAKNIVSGVNSMIDKSG